MNSNNDIVRALDRISAQMRDATSEMHTMNRHMHDAVDTLTYALRLIDRMQKQPQEQQPEQTQAQTAETVSE